MKRSASAIFSPERTGRVEIPASLMSAEGATISMRALDTVVNARMGELFSVVREELDAAGVLHRPTGGVVLTGGGGLAVSGSGASVVLSGGAIVASAGNIGDHPCCVRMDGNVTVTCYDANVGDSSVVSATWEGLSVSAPSGILINGHPAATENFVSSATQLVTSVSDDPSALIDVLSGGTSLFYTESLYQVDVSSVVKTTDASYLHFTLDSVTAPTPVVLSGVSYLNSATFEGGKEYLVGIFDGMCVVNEVTSGGAQQ